MWFCSKLKFWNSEESNTITGSDGSAFHPLLTKEERIHIFTPDLCRYIGEALHGTERPIEPTLPSLGPQYCLANATKTFRPQISDR